MAGKALISLHNSFNFSALIFYRSTTNLFLKSLFLKLLFYIFCYSCVFTKEFKGFELLRLTIWTQFRNRKNELFKTCLSIVIVYNSRCVRNYVNTFIDLINKHHN